MRSEAVFKVGVTAASAAWLVPLKAPQHKAEATVTLSGRTLHADAAAVDMYAAIDLLADKLDRLLMKHKGKMVDHHRGEGIAQNDAFG